MLLVLKRNLCSDVNNAYGTTRMVTLYFLQFLPLRELSVELVLPRLPHELGDVVVLLPQVLVERLALEFTPHL